MPFAERPRREAGHPPRRPFGAFSAPPPDGLHVKGESAPKGLTWRPLLGAPSCYLTAYSPTVQRPPGGSAGRALKGLSAGGLASLWASLP
eukprot:8538604-Alexandrium_andersonii.AAC.1